MLDLGAKGPRVFVQGLGSDFPRAVVDGLKQRARDMQPQDMARVTLIVNTARMGRRIKELFQQSPGFLPRILQLDTVERLLPVLDIPPKRSPLERRLQLAQLLQPLLATYPELAAQNSLFAVTDSLARLMDEMQGEGVGISAIANLDVSDDSGHWAFAKSLIEAAHTYVAQVDGGLDQDARQRLVAKRLIAHWEATPPTHPIVLAGSTGSRGTTHLLMEAIAHMPQGAVILPGFDRQQPATVWDTLSDALSGEDHPQFRFAKLCQNLQLEPDTLPDWAAGKHTQMERGAVLSLALRPAPVTSAWLTEGPDLQDLPTAFQDVSLIEAPSQRSEALAIAMRLRQAAEDGQTAALITPDRLLGRQVTAALDRWGIEPEDSGGMPLHLSPPGRFLRHVAGLFSRPLDAEALMVLLKHPLTQSHTGQERHGLYRQEMELRLRKTQGFRATPAGLNRLAGLVSDGLADTSGFEEWAQWLLMVFPDQVRAGRRPLGQWVCDHRALAEAIAGGWESGLWLEAAGRAALAGMENLQAHADHAGDLRAQEYEELLSTQLQSEEVRTPDDAHPGIMIWGTLEARVQGADLVILGGLNEGSWPEAVTADAWLNRRMRAEAGLLLPERRVGLSAHDFQQAIMAPEVWLSRSVRSDDSETVPSRWVNRIVNLVTGLPMCQGPQALEAMRARGATWLAKVGALEDVAHVNAARRAAPKPPVAVRPRDLSVTEIERLIRDPYAIYARHILGLRKIDPLMQKPDARMRGTVLHSVMEQFVADVGADNSALSVDHLMACTDAVLAKHVPTDTVRMAWRGSIARAAEWIVETERSRQESGQNAILETVGRLKLALDDDTVTLTGRADRTDQHNDGSVTLYDYKTGAIPSGKEQTHFDKQLILEAAMIAEGAFADLGPREVRDAVHIGVTHQIEKSAPLATNETAKVLGELRELLAHYLEPDQHYLSRRAVKTERFTGDYDHLARHGEWEDTDPPAPEDLA